MTTARFRLLLLLLMLAGTPMTVLAQTGLNEVVRSVHALDVNFDAADKNHDGVLSRQEAAQVPYIANNFDAIDTQHRGVVSKDDLHRYIAAQLKGAHAAPASSTSAMHP
jgi:hypothetical protein